MLWVLSANLLCKLTKLLFSLYTLDSESHKEIKIHLLIHTEHSTQFAFVMSMPTDDLEYSYICVDVV